MPYSSISELPQAVRDRIKKPKKLRQWMHVWNSVYDQYHDESRAFAGANSVVAKAAGVSSVDKEFNFFLPLSKIDKETRTVSGYASTACVDLDGEVISQDAIKAALPEYWQWRNIREMHQPSAVGIAKEANIDDKGLWLTAKIVDDGAWQKVEEGVYKGFSIGGRKLSKMGNTVTKVSLVEISVVDRPCNPECSFAVNKSASSEGPAHLLPENADDISETGEEKEPDNDQDDAAILASGETSDPRKRITKREFSTKERKQDAKSGAALPDGSFPIENEQDLKNAIRAIGRASNPDAARSHIRSRAKSLGLSSLLPSEWKKMIKAAKKLAKSKESVPTSSPVTHGTDGGAEAALSKVECSHELDLEGLSLHRRDDSGSDFSNLLTLKKRKGKVMSELDQNSALTKALIAAGVVKVPNPALALVKASQEDMKDMKSERKDMEDCVKALFELHKTAFVAQQALVKTGQIKAGEGFDHEAAMKSLKKVFEGLQKVKILTKSASKKLAKAATSDGMVQDAVSGVYEVPAGVRTISDNEMDNLPANKAAKANKGDFISKEHAETLAKLAKAEAEAELLKSMPAGPMFGKQPATFDVSKLTVGADNSALMRDINPADLRSPDDSIRESAMAKMVGNRILSGGGHSIFDPRFHGTAGGSA